MKFRFYVEMRHKNADGFDRPMPMRRMDHVFRIQPVTSGELSPLTFYGGDGIDQYTVEVEKNGRAAKDLHHF